MPWWIVFQIGQWLMPVTTPPEAYLLADDVFFAQTSSNQFIALDNPDTLLLDVALFQATNEARRAARLPILNYDPHLYQAARGHAESMIRFDYIRHENLYQLAESTLLRRVERLTNRFHRMAENIGQYQTIDTPEWYGVRVKAHSDQFEYVDPTTKHPCQPYTYAQYARYAVQQWLASPHHRANLLNPIFTHVGCAGRLSLRPFHQRQAPYGRLVQDFGCLRLLNQASR